MNRFLVGLLVAFVVLMWVPGVGGVGSAVESFTYAPGDWNGVYWLTNSVDVAPGVAGSWQTVDVSAYVPSNFNATGVVLDVHNNRSSGSTGWRAAVRAFDSTDNYYAYSYVQGSGQTGLKMVGLDSNKQFKAEVESANIELWLMGFTDNSVTFFTNAKDYSTVTTGSWVDTDVSSDVGSDATGVVVMMMKKLNAPTTFGNGTVRPIGSSDDHAHRAIAYLSTIYAIVKLNSTGFFQQFIEYADIDLYLVGYTTGTTFGWFIDDVDVSPAVEDAWVNIDSTTVTGTGIFLEMVYTSGSQSNTTIRKIGSTDDRTSYAKITWISEHYWHPTGLNSTGFYQAFINSTTVDHYITGYTKNITHDTTVTTTNRIDTVTNITVNGALWTDYTYTQTWKTIDINNLTENSVIIVNYTIFTPEPDLVEPIPFPSVLIFLQEGDWLGFLQAIYVNSFMSVELFYGFIILLLMTPLYIRTRSLALICILWILLGGGIIAAAPMVAPLGIGFLALGIAGILVKIFTSLR